MIISSASGSGNTLEFQQDGQDKAVLFVEARAGKKSIGVHVTRTVLVEAMRDLGLYVTSLAEAQDALETLTKDLREENTEQANKLAAVGSVLCSVELEDAEESEDVRVQALQEIYNILHPAPPYTFPTKYGAAVRAKHKHQDRIYHFQHVEDSNGAEWVSHRGGWYTEAELRGSWTDFETITEGIDE